MKNLLYSTIFLIITLSACSKKSETNPTPSNEVTINGSNYTTAVIGKQTWTTANYSGAGGFDSLYTWAQAEAITLPSGWRLPTETDYNGLLELAGGTLNSDGYVLNANAVELMSKSTWSGNVATNALGFTATSVGYAITPGPDLIGQGNFAVFWSSSSNVPGEPLSLIISQSPPYPPGTEVDKQDPDYYLSVRFVKDN